MKRPFAALLPWLCLAVACSAEEPTEQAESAALAVTPRGPNETFFVVLAGPAAVKAIPTGTDARSPAAGAATKKRVLEIETEQAAIEALVVAEGAEVIARISRLANALQIVTDAKTAQRIENLPGVLRVERVPVIERSLLSAVPAVGAPAAWTGTPGFTGEGIVIGIVDSGIDYTHADFAGIGTAEAYAANDSSIIEPGSFPTAKVIGGWDFAGDTFNPSAGLTSPNPDDDPLDCTTPGSEQISGGHGTHVAGIAAGTGVAADGSSFAGPYEASLDPNAFKVGPGVAPGASLFALKIFGCEGSTTLLAAALDRAADPNNDGSFDDRLDVVNASLGTSYALGADMTGEMVTALTDVGSLLVVAAGNDGQSFFTLGSPAAYPEVLAVAASTDTDLLNMHVTSPPAAVADYPAAEGAFTVRLANTGPIAGELVLADPVLGCTAFNNAAQVAGKIALIDRGTCPFVDKFSNAVAAGAIAAVIVDDDDVTLPFAMSGAPNSSPIPGVMVTLDNGAELKAALANGPLTITLDAADHYTGPGAELLAGFSSRGPSAVDGRLKPEISAPGSAIDSAGVGSGTEPRLNQGTSMACPMVAGAAALVRQAHPGLSAMGVKALLMGTAAPLRDFALAPYATTVVGAGRVDVARAVQPSVIAAADLFNGDVGVSFGSLIEPGQATETRAFDVTNFSDTAKSLALSVGPTFELPGVTVTVEPTTLSLAPGETATAELTLSFDPVLLGDAGADPGTPPVQGQQTPQPRHFLNQASGLVHVDDGTSDVVLPYTGSLRAAADERGVPPTACGAALAASEPVTIAREDGGAHPAPVVTAFQLVALDDADNDSKDDRVVAMADLRAVGVATNLATAASFDEAQVYFGVAVEGPWATAARGPLSVVKIRVDSDQSGSNDFEIRVEARNPDGPFRDALIASTYDLSNGERLGRFPINIVAPDIAHSYPFNSTVLVLAANLAELEVDEANPVFDFTAQTERADLLVANDKAEGTFDAKNPLLDTARHGLDGQPIFLAGEPVRVQLADSANEADALDVLLLHHTNAPGKQWEVVSLVKAAPGNLSLNENYHLSVAADATTDVSLEVKNEGSEVAPNVMLSANALGGQVVSATSTAGICTTASALECSLGDLEPGGTIEVIVTLRPSEGSSSLGLQPVLTSDLPCELEDADNEVIVSIVVEAALVDPKDELEPGGGCDCATSGTDSRGVSEAWLAIAMAALAARRRRSRASASVSG